MRDDDLELVETCKFSVLCLRKHRAKWFGRSVARFTRFSDAIDLDDAALRALMAPHLRKMRQQRGALVHPARPLRQFTFDVRRYPLADALRELLGVPDLARVHDRRSDEGWKRRLLAPLLDAARRRRFLDLYDDFVRRVALPAVAPAERSEVRYQACPCVRVHCPGEVTIGPHCDAMYGHDARTVNVHVPLTAARGTSALVVERTVGAEDFAALEVGGCGAAFAFVGGVAAHFGAENHTKATRCSLDLRLRFFAAAGDAYEAPGYFAAATRRADGAWVRRTGALEPDARVGLPFT